MYARVTWYGGPPDRIEAGIRAFEDGLPMVQQLPGYLGAALLVDRATGEAATIGYYRDQQSLTATQPKAREIRDEATRATGNKVIRVEEYEITLMERAQPGTTGKWGRLITGTGEISRMEEATDLLRKSVAVLKQQPGFRSFVAGANRQNGAAFTGATFDTREQLEASNAALVDARDQIRERAQIKDLKVQVFEIAVADVTASSGAAV